MSRKLRTSMARFAFAAGFGLAAIDAAAQSSFACILPDDSVQLANRDLSHEFPLAIKSCRTISPGAREKLAPSPIPSAAPSRQYRCVLFDDSLQMADRDLSADYPATIKSCKPLAWRAEPVLAMSVDTPVDALAVVRQAPHVAGQASARRTSATQPIASMIHAASILQGLDPALVSALVYVESRYNPGAQSPKGAMGLMQIMPATAARYGVSVASTLMDPQVNVDVGTRYLRDLAHQFHGRTELVLAAYNAGEGSVQRFGYRVPPFAETQNYVRQIMGLSGVATD